MNVKIEGLEAAMKKLDMRAWEPITTKFLQQAGQVMEAHAKGRSPVDTGRLRASITHVLGNESPPMSVLTGTNVEPYPQILDESAAHHYREGTPFDGEPTAGWLSGHTDEYWPKIEALLARAAQEIAALWRQ